jgi:hypothetical protein
MKLLRAVGTCFLLCALGCLLQVLPVFSQTAAAGLVHTGTAREKGVGRALIEEVYRGCIGRRTRQMKRP